MAGNRLNKQLNCNLMGIASQRPGGDGDLINKMTSDVNRYRLERCPKCGSKELQRSRRKNILEYAIGFAFRPWRCGVCFVRFFRPRWMKAAPRRVDIAGRFDKKPSDGTTPVKAVPTAPGSTDVSLSTGKETAPRFVKRNPMLGFFVPARRKMRDVQDTMSLSAKQFGSRPLQ